MTDQSAPDISATLSQWREECLAAFTKSLMPLSVALESDVSPVFLINQFLILRQNSAILTRLIGFNQSSVALMQRQVLTAKSHRQALFSEALVSSHFVAAGPDAKSREARALAIAEAEVDPKELEELEAALSELLTLDKVLSIGLKDLDAARRDLESLSRLLGMNLQSVRGG